LNGSIKIDYKYRAIDDIKKNIIRINPKIEDNIIGVDFVFDCIKCASSTEFSLDMATVTKIFSLHKQLLNISKQRLNYYIRYIFSNGGKPRKTVALLNTLGISKLLFGCNLLETTTINHLKKEDTLELLSIIFSTVNDPKTTFQQLCFSEEDITYMLTVMDILNSITFDTDSLDTNLLFKTIKNEKIKVIERILTTFGLHNLRKKIKEKRNTDIMIEKLAITEDDIKLCFRNADVEKMLKTALEKVKNDPRLNSKPTLLLLLNKER
jgi:NACalpha-BTF3-like transcription factor